MSRSRWERLERWLTTEEHPVLATVAFCAGLAGTLFMIWFCMRFGDFR